MGKAILKTKPDTSTINMDKTMQGMPLEIQCPRWKEKWLGSLEIEQ